MARTRIGIYSDTIHVLWISIDLDPDNLDKEEDTHVIIADVVGSCTACAGVMEGADFFEGVGERERYMQHVRYLIDRATIVDNYEKASKAFVEAVNKAVTGL